jgi:hypothetical protein
MSASAMSEGVVATSIPHSLKTAILAAAVSSAPPNDGPRVAHAPAGRSRGSGDESRNRLSEVCLHPARGLDLGVSADLPDHHDAPLSRDRR